MTDQQFTPPSTVFMKWKLADEGQLRIQKWSQFPFDGAISYAMPAEDAAGANPTPSSNPMGLIASQLRTLSGLFRLESGDRFSVSLKAANEIVKLGFLAASAIEATVKDSTVSIVSGWQPIATAPTTGEEIIGRTGPEWGSFSCRWNGEVFVHIDGDDGYINYSPTEWVPMPGPSTEDSPCSRTGVPEGWALVPVEATDAMMKAGEKWSGLSSQTWTDMLDAAPTSEGSAMSTIYTQAECDEMCEIAGRDGYEKAVQEIDQKTGGDGEYRYCFGMEDSDRHTPDAPAMIQRIVDRFEVLNLLDESTRTGSDQPDDSPIPKMGTGQRQGDWMQTVSGRQFWPIDPRPEDVFIEDIAHALSMMCRFGGHCERFYSVAEHSVLVSENVPPEDALWALLHDASEAYIADIVRPAKRFLSNYKEVEGRIMTAVCTAFNLPVIEPPSVKRADNAILADEAAQIMGTKPKDWILPEPPLGVRIIGLSPADAKQAFMTRYRALSATATEGSADV